MEIEMYMNQHSIGKSIKIMRTSKDLSQQDIANLIGYKNPISVSHWEQNLQERPISFRDFMKIADKCGFTIKVYNNPLT